LYRQIIEGHISTVTQVVEADHVPAYPAGQVLGDEPTLFGREQERQQIADYLARPDCSLLTLHGPGGSGKTVLAQWARLAHASGFPDGAHQLIIEDPGHQDALLTALAQLDGASPEKPASYEEVLQFLSGKRLLLVIDEFEQLQAQRLVLSRLLRDAPGLTVLVTSQVRLGLEQEWVLPVGELSPLPDDSGSETFPTVRLFLAASDRQRVGFLLGDEDRRAIGRICRLLDGLPLGIILAARWVRLLSPAEIADELERGLEWLQSDMPGLPPRQQSLHASAEYGWQFLLPAEQAALRRLLLLSERFTREMAAQEAAVSLPLLGALADKSAIRREAGGQYQIFRPLRDYLATHKSPAD
jgi:predicted ATPase